MSWREIMGVAPAAPVANPQKHTQYPQKPPRPTAKDPVGRAESLETARIAATDARRNEHDKAFRRGYDYEAPSSVTPSELPDDPAQREIDPGIVAEIERIEGQALALGWSRERLWNSNFWHPRPRGLAAVMDAGDRIVEVTGDYIAIERPQATRVPLLLRFWRTDG
jgi:hypothetical protein